MNKLNDLREQAKQAEDSQPQESSEVEAQNASALSPDQPIPGVTNDPGRDGSGFLLSFLHATPLFDLFEHVAERTYPGLKPHARIAKLKAISPRFYLLCQYGELAIRAVITIALVTLAIKVAFKVVD